MNPYKVTKKKFLLCQSQGRGVAEVVFSYPVFKSVDEGLKYIKDICGTNGYCIGINEE